MLIAAAWWVKLRMTHADSAFLAIHWHFSPIAWLLAATIFCAGFLWEFRRVSR